MPSSVSVGSRPRALDDALDTRPASGHAARRTLVMAIMRHRRRVGERSPVRPPSRPTRKAPGRRRCRPRARTPARDAASGRRRCGASLQMPAMLCDRPVGIRLVDVAARRRRRSGRRPAGSLRAARSRRARRSSCLRRARSESAAPGPARHATVNGVSVCSTRTCTCSQRNFRLRLRSIAPGSSPASSST